MERRILRFGEESLREESKPVAKIDDEIRDLVRDMFEVMYQIGGVGLAAPQVGVNIRLFTVDTGDAPMIFINPCLVKAVGKDLAEEGCLSFPGLREKVERPARVVARAIDLDGNEFEVQAEGLLARAIQHEIDHLDGVLFIDRISKARRLQIRRSLERIAAGESLESDLQEEREA